jgi:hypothetical protein
METRHEIRQVEGIKCACVWAKDDIKVDLQEIGKRKLDFFRAVIDGGTFEMCW